jgi:hypothetical protein
MSFCATCVKYLGQHRDHGGDPCPVAASFWCSQCGCHGHLPSACDEVTHVDRPRTLEELIPEDVRARWGITTSTPIIWTKPTLAVQEREIAESNTIEVRYREGKQDSKIREIMRFYKIPTVHKMEGNIQKLREWAVANGKKVRLLQER